MKRPLVVFGLLGLVGCVEEAPEVSTNMDAPSFEEFLSSVHQLEDGSYVVNGDEPMFSIEELEAFYWEVYGDGQLIVNRVGNADDRWTDAQAGNLTYCVSTKFGSNHAAIRDAVAAGAAMWEGASSTIDFVYLPQHDGSCTTRNNSVLFSVEPTKDPSIYARAFFPSSSSRSQNVVVNAKLTLRGDYPAADILGHELGHTLGFRHEHTRPEAGTCFENSSWRELTEYDANSIMHYPTCNGGPNALSWSSLDAQGTAALYGN
jgi:hypothetical protein